MKKKNFLVGNVIDSIDKNSKGTILRSIAIFTAIELCGSIYRGETGLGKKGRGTTRDNFTEFCSSKYMPIKYHTISNLLYEIFRNGVAHSYIPKGAALLSSDPKEKKYHLKFLVDGLSIYVPSFSKDVAKAIRLFYKDVKSDSILKGNYQKVISQLNSDGLQYYQKFITSENIKPKEIKITQDIERDLV